MRNINLDNSTSHYMKKTAFIFLLSTVLMMSSCRQEDVVFRGISDPQVKDLSLTKATILTEAIMYNPNRQGGKVKNIEILVRLNGTEVAKVTEVQKIRVRGKSEFRVPLQVEIPFTSKGVSDGLMDVIKGRKTRLSYEGNITFKTLMISYDVPVSMEEDIKLKLF